MPVAQVAAVVEPGEAVLVGVGGAGHRPDPAVAGEEGEGREGRVGRGGGVQGGDGQGDCEGERAFVHEQTPEWGRKA